MSNDKWKMVSSVVKSSAVDFIIEGTQTRMLMLTHDGTRGATGLRHGRKRMADVRRRRQSHAQEEAADPGNHDRLLHRLRRLARLHRVLPNRSLHVLGNRSRSSTLRPHRSRSLSVYWLSEMHEQGPGRRLPRRLSLGCD